MKKFIFMLTMVLSSILAFADEVAPTTEVSNVVATASKPDTEILIYSAIGGAVVAILALVVLKLKGRDTLIRLITRAEVIFDYGKNSEKLEYVLSNARMVIPAPFKWFITKESIGKLVKFLREDLGIIQKSKSPSGE